MGNPIRIVELIHHLIAEVELELGKDIEIEITEPSPGEKTTEELVVGNGSL